jgi:hypothetical protein
MSNPPMDNPWSSGASCNYTLFCELQIASVDALNAVAYAANAACKFIMKSDDHKNSDKPKTTSNGSKPKRPLIVLSFDESEQLTKSTVDDRWSIFSELRRALRCFGGRPIFSLFLSTAGNFEGFSPAIELDKSARVAMRQLVRLPIIAECGFDELACPLILGKTTLEVVSKVRFMCHYGRPL